MNALTYRHRLLLFFATLCCSLSTVASASLSAQPALEDTVVEETVIEDNQPYVPETGDLKMVAVVAISSYDQVISDLNFAGSLGERPQLGQMVEGMLTFFTGGKGLVAVDKTKPWGVILQTDGSQFLPVVCLPVSDFDGLMELVGTFGVPVTDGDNGVKQIATPDGQTVHVKHEGGWAYASQSPTSLDNLPADPEAQLAPLVDEYDIGATLMVQNVPPMYRQMAIQAMKSGMEDGLKRQEGEDEESYQARRDLAEKQVAQIERMLNEFEELTIGWALDADGARTYLDVFYRFVPGSNMAKQAAAMYEGSHTNFAGFFQPEAAVTFSMATDSDPELMQEDLEQMRAMFANVRRQGEKAIDEDSDLPDDAARDAFKSALNDFLDAAQATVEAGRMDGGGALHLRPGSLTFVAGAHIKQPEKIEAGLKKVASVAEKRPDFPGVQWNADSHAGVSFHTVSVPIPADEEEARKMFGDQVDVALGIGGESIYVAIGNDNLGMVKQAIDASAAEPDKEVPPFEISASLGQIMTMAATGADEEDRAMVESIADMLNTQAQGRDHIRATGKAIENGLRYRIEAEEGVLRAIGKAAAEAQKKAQQQQMGPG